MPSHNSYPPRFSGSDCAGIDVAGRSKLKHTRKSQSVVSTPDSASPTFQPFLCVATPASLFLSLTVEILPGDTTAVVDAPIPPVPGSPIAYEKAITRLNDLVAEGSITSAQRDFLHAAMHTAQYFVRFGQVHCLLETIASPLTSHFAIMEMASTVEAGIDAFLTRPQTSSLHEDHWSERSTPSQNDFVGFKCAARNNRTCVVSRNPGFGLNCHLIPLAVWGEKAESFWALVDMFQRPASTELLQTLMLGYPPTTCNIRNSIWLTYDTKYYLYGGKLSLVPDISGLPYDPATVTEYAARVEFPFGTRSVILSSWTLAPNCKPEVEMLLAGGIVTLRTSDPVLYPLPHPIILQLHTVFTRLCRMCANAGILTMPINAERYWYPGECDEYEYEYEDDEYPPPQLTDNDYLPTENIALPLNRSLLEVFNRNQGSEAQQYGNVIDRWTSDAEGYPGVPGESQSRKRTFEDFESDFQSWS